MASRLHTCKILYFGLVAIVSCSSGDRSMEFGICTAQCNQQDCVGVVKLPLVLRILQWSCVDNCHYECMHNVTREDIAHGRPIRQFFGKMLSPNHALSMTPPHGPVTHNTTISYFWPFVRFLGIQEPASSLFSLLNGVTIFTGYMLFRQRTPKAYLYHPMFFVQLLVCLHTWFWSFVFHSRDVSWTEKLDYFSAASMIVTGLLVQFIRITGKGHTKWHITYCALWAGLFCCHVMYLSMYKFDYGYNMIASVGAGGLYFLVWAIWCIKNWAKRPYVWKCLASVFTTTCFLTLELLDFPPIWWTFDAHSLWHLATVPVPLLWYSFLTDDAKYEIELKLLKEV